MSLPYGDPSLPSLAAPIFNDVDASRNDHLRANNSLIWQDMKYLDDKIIADEGNGGAAPAKTMQQLYNALIALQAGWNLDTHTWEYVSADAPVYVVRVNADMTTILHVGQKIKYTQTTTKYGIITAIGSYSGGYTNITIYAGGNTASPSYAMTSGAITNPYYAAVWRPLDFPMNPDTWSYIVTDTQEQIQNSPVNGTWYNLGSISIAIPIGLWNVKYQVALSIVSANYTAFFAGLSTSNNSISDPYFLIGAKGYVNSSATFSHIGKNMLLTSKTSYYLIEMTTSGTVLRIYTDSTMAGYTYSYTIIKAVCQYL
jgi:hypothetical protein